MMYATDAHEALAQRALDQGESLIKTLTEGIASFPNRDAPGFDQFVSAQSGHVTEIIAGLYGLGPEGHQAASVLQARLLAATTCQAEKEVNETEGADSVNQKNA